MGVIEGSCTLYVPRKAAFQQQDSTSKPSYIKYGVFTVGDYDWEIQVYPNGSGTLALHLCLLSDTSAEVTRTEIWTNPDYSDLEFDYADNIHKPNVPKEIDSVTVASSDKNDCVTIKVVLSVIATDKPAKPNNQWNPDNADISFDSSNTKPISNKPAEPQWNPSNADVSFDSSKASGSWTGKPNKPSAAWDTSKADISFDNAKSS